MSIVDKIKGLLEDGEQDITKLRSWFGAGHLGAMADVADHIEQVATVAADLIPGTAGLAEILTTLRGVQDRIVAEITNHAITAPADAVTAATAAVIASPDPAATESPAAPVETPQAPPVEGVVPDATDTDSAGDVQVDAPAVDVAEDPTPTLVSTPEQLDAPAAETTTDTQPVAELPGLGVNHVA